MSAGGAVREGETGVRKAAFLQPLSSSQATLLSDARGGEVRLDDSAELTASAGLAGGGCSSTAALCEAKGESITAMHAQEPGARCAPSTRGNSSRSFESFSCHTCCVYLTCSGHGKEATASISREQGANLGQKPRRLSL